MVRSFESSGLFSSGSYSSLSTELHPVDNSFKKFFHRLICGKPCVLTDTSRTPNSNLLQHLIHLGRHLLTFNLVYVVVLAVKRMQRRELPA